jgi:hypothetical protein
VSGIDDLLTPRTTAVWLNEEEISLLKAGLAAHSIALDPWEKTDPEEVRAQRKARHALFDRLSDAQREVSR